MIRMDNKLSLQTCLLCNIYFDQKPVILPEESLAAAELNLLESSAKFRTAFSLFCNLLKIGNGEGHKLVQVPESDNDKDEGHQGQFGSVGGGDGRERRLLPQPHPCCGECLMALLDLLRLEELIEETKTQQREILGRLKETVSSNSNINETSNRDKDNLWMKERAQLRECLRPCEGINPFHGIGNDDEIGNFDSYSANDDDDPMEAHHEFAAIPKQEEIDQDSQKREQRRTGCSRKSKSDTLQKGERGRPRKHQEPLEVVAAQKKSSPSVLSPSLEKSCSISLVRLKEEDLPLIVRLNANKQTSNPTNTDNGGSVLGEKKSSVSKISTRGYRLKGRRSKAKGKKTTKSFKSSTRKGKRGRRRKEVEESDGGDDGIVRALPKPRRKLAGNRRRTAKECFLQINDELLLLNCTPIKVSPVGFTCQEEGCGHLVEGSDYFTFEGMRSHVIECHASDSESEAISRTCPICPDSLRSTHLLRHHLLLKHSESGPDYFKQIVVCESCWKPMHYHTYHQHTWHHKNEEEKIALVSSGESICPRVTRKLSFRLIYSKVTGQGTELLEDRRGKRKRRQSSEEEEEVDGDDDKQQSGSDSDYKPSSDRPRSKFPVKRKYFKSHSGKFTEQNTFFLLTDSFLFYNDLLVQFTPTEFLCRKEGCGISVLGSDYFTFEDFQKHAKLCHRQIIPGSKQVCPLCSGEFEEASEFRKHIFQEHTPPPVCPSCWKPLEPSESLADHTWTHMSEEEKTNKFKKKKPQIWNPNSGRGPESFCCQTCPKQFPTMATLRKHEETHLPPNLRPQFPCPECGLKLLSRTGLKVHIERVHQPDLQKKRRKCDLCGKEFHYRDKIMYQTHMRSHTGETPFVCEICGKGCKNVYILRKHVKAVHDTVGRPHQCEFCEASYKQMKNLRDHQKIRHGLQLSLNEAQKLKRTNPLYRPGFIGPRIAYPCEHCEKYFKRPAELTRHLSKAHPNYAEYRSMIS